MWNRLVAVYPLFVRGFSSFFPRSQYISGYRQSVMWKPLKVLIMILCLICANSEKKVIEENETSITSDSDGLLEVFFEVNVYDEYKNMSDLFPSNQTNIEDFEVFDSRDALNVFAYALMSAGKGVKNF